MHIRNLLDNSRRKVNQLHKVVSTRNINLSVWQTVIIVCN